MNAEAYRVLACSNCGFKRRVKDFLVSRLPLVFCDNVCEKRYDRHLAPQLPPRRELPEVSARIMSVSEAQAKLRGGRCPFCGNKPKVLTRPTYAQGRETNYLTLRNFCEHLWSNWGYGQPEELLTNPASWQGPGWPYRGGLLVSASGADSYEPPEREKA